MTVKTFVLAFFSIDEQVAVEKDKQEIVEGIYGFNCPDCGEVWDSGDSFANVAKLHMEVLHPDTEYTVSLDDVPSSDDEVVEDVPVVFTCAGVTNSGKSCSRTVDNDGDYCYQHQPAEEVEPEPEPLPEPPAEIVVPEDVVTTTADPVQEIRDMIAQAKKVVGGFIEDIKPHQDELMQYGQMVDGLWLEADNLKALREDLNQLLPTDAVEKQKKAFDELISDIQLKIIALKNNPLYAEYRPISHIINEQRERAERIREQAIANEEKIASMVKQAYAVADEKRKLFTDILNGVKWLPSLKYDAEPLVKNAWFRANDELNNIEGINITWKERRNYGVYARILPIVFDKIFNQYIVFDKEDIVVGDVTVPAFTKAEAYRMFDSMFQKVHYKYFAQRNKEGIEAAGADYWGELDVNNMAVRLMGKSATESFMAMNNLDADALVNVKGGEALLKLRTQVAQADDPKAEEPIS